MTCLAGGQQIGVSEAFPKRLDVATVSKLSGEAWSSTD
jgi:hypothetical protein